MIICLSMGMKLGFSPEGNAYVEEYFRTECKEYI
jgi:hypothetical protein